MRILLISTFFLISGGVDCDDVTGYKGGSVLIDCYYTNKNYVNHTKYFCKLDRTNQCMEKFLSNESTAPNPDQKIFFMDETQPGWYSVLIKNISLQDEGIYRCGVEKGNQFTDVKLKVEEDTCCGKSFPHKAHPGETVTFSCKYPAEFQQYFKYLYKVADHSLSAVIYIFGSSLQEGRFSVSDHKEQHLFNVSISNLTVEDAGVYLCGAQHVTRDPYYSLFNEMQLQVEVLSYSVNITSSTSLIIITVSICAVLLLIGGLILIYYKLRHKKTEGSPNMEMGTSNPTDVDYENDPPRNNQNIGMNSTYQNQPPNINQSDSVYQTLNPNANPSDSVYQTLNPNANQSDSVYQTLNPNANPSDSVYQTLNPNANQSDSVYQTLNPNANPSDSVYHTLNPNTNQSDSVYHTLNPNGSHSD